MQWSPRMVALAILLSYNALATDLLYTRFTNGLAGGVNLLDTSTGEVTPVIPTGQRWAYRITADLLESKIYWSSQISAGGATGGGIRRANLDGSNVELNVPYTGAPNFLATAFNPDNRKILWSQNFLLRQSNPDGSNIQTLHSAASLIQDIAVDTEHDKIYFSDFNGTTSGRLRRMNFDGSGVETVVDQILSGPVGLGIDAARDRIYWGRFSFGPELGGISSARLDGTDLQHVLTDIDVDSLAVDSAGEQIYFTTVNNSFTEGEIQRINFDGTNPRTYDLGTFLPGGITLIPEPASASLMLVAVIILRQALRR